MVTVLCDAESVINSRPLSHVSQTDSELIPLSRNSFLQDFRQIGVPNLDQVNEVVLNKRIKYRQQLITDIRKRLRSEYLGLLIQRSENKKPERDIKLGEVVMIGSDDVKCNDWPLSVVIKLLPAKDCINRLVCRRTAKGELLRSVQRIFPLEISNETFGDDV
ncbi:integrase catalytic domain-containing protein [Nephila pilipes]|uniref:Integrase catalytic domain-containing protein n=1 Tax=Nephila pilipes TaxID=299642 RepID=A0A8X6P8D9_NEPPI|nr:integrase catalytic domain-containing protein [Nephila pilipes]